MTSHVMIVIFENGDVDMCELKIKDNFTEVLPFKDNTFIVNDFKIASVEKTELMDDIRGIFLRVDYISIREKEKDE